MFDMIEKGKPLKGGKDRSGKAVRVMTQRSDSSTNALNSLGEKNALLQQLRYKLNMLKN